MIRRIDFIRARWIREGVDPDEGLTRYRMLAVKAGLPVEALEAFLAGPMTVQDLINIAEADAITDEDRQRVFEEIRDRRWRENGPKN